MVQPPAPLLCGTGEKFGSVTEVRQKGQLAKYGSVSCLVPLALPSKYLQTVIEAPGHSAGHVAFWRESDRVLILGDVLANMDQYTGIPGLNAPKDALTPDPARNRESAKKLAALEPELVCFGHGAPLRNPGKLKKFVDGLGA